MNERVRVIGGPWPERIGCTGVVVEPEGEPARRYPWAGRAKNEVIVLLDFDPLGPARDDPPWSCALSRLNLAHLEGERE